MNWDFPKAGDLHDVLRCEDDLSLAPARVRELSASGTFPEPRFSATHEGRGLCRLEELQIH